MAHQRLTNFPHDPLLDLEPWVGQRQATYRFERFNAVSGEELGTVHPLRNSTLTHDTTRIIKRQLTMDLGTLDTAEVNTVSDRIRVFMVFPTGAEYPLGVYMFTDDTRQQYTSGSLGRMVLNDEMFLVDQAITAGFSGVIMPESHIFNFFTVQDAVSRVLAGVPVRVQMEGSPYTSFDSWGVGTYRGQILEQLSITGDYFSPWFDNTGTLRFIRTFEPHESIADFDFDDHVKVVREPIILTTDLLTAPNRFIVISNAPEDNSQEVVGVADVPSTAPHSILNRGFIIADVRNMPAQNTTQAEVIAENFARRFTVFERVSLTTPPDPRHDSYNVIRWQGSNWLELAWSMSLVEGGGMSHLLRKAYGE